jgi:hypothetical protein
VRLSTAESRKYSYQTDWDKPPDLLSDKDLNDACEEYANAGSVAAKKTAYSKNGCMPCQPTQVGSSAISCVPSADILHQLAWSVVRTEVLLLVDIVKQDKEKYSGFQAAVHAINEQIPSELKALIHIKTNDKASLASEKASKWLSFLCVHARICFLGRVPDLNFRCLELLVEFTELCLQSTFRQDDLRRMDQLVKMHEKAYVDLYEWQNTRIAHHLCGHLAQSIRRFGPLLSQSTFWTERNHLFFKRMSTSNVEGSLQNELMRRFVFTFTAQYPAEKVQHPDVEPLVNKILAPVRPVQVSSLPPSFFPEAYRLARENGENEVLKSSHVFIREKMWPVIFSQPISPKRSPGVGFRTLFAT